MWIRSERYVDFVLTQTISAIHTSYYTYSYLLLLHFSQWKANGTKRKAETEASVSEWVHHMLYQIHKF